jgi:uncharacterized lipoprotein YajG
MIKIIALVSTLLLLTGCSKTISQANISREVTTLTFESIISDANLKTVVKSLDETNKTKFRTWFNEKLIPYVSYLETELQYSTPNSN